jgi:hypothetical protein
MPIERVGYLTDLLSDKAVEYVTRRHSRPDRKSTRLNSSH